MRSWFVNLFPPISSVTLSVTSLHIIVDLFKIYFPRKYWSSYRSTLQFLRFIVENRSISIFAKNCGIPCFPAINRCFFIFRNPQKFNPHIANVFAAIIIDNQTRCFRYQTTFYQTWWWFRRKIAEKFTIFNAKLQRISVFLLQVAVPRDFVTFTAMIMYNVFLQKATLLRCVSLLTQALSSSISSILTPLFAGSSCCQCSEVRSRSVRAQRLLRNHW